MADPQAAVEALLDDDRAPGPAATIGSPRQGEVAARPADRAVPTDPAWIVEAEDGVGAGDVGPRPPGRLGIGGGHGEPSVVAFEETRQVGVGRLDRRDPRQTQLANEPVLERAPQALDSALGLGRVRSDPADGRLVRIATGTRCAGVRSRLPWTRPAEPSSRYRRSSRRTWRTDSPRTRAASSAVSPPVRTWLRTYRRCCARASKVIVSLVSMRSRVTKSPAA